MLLSSTVKVVNQHAAGGKLVVLTAATLACWGVGLAAHSAPLGAESVQVPVASPKPPTGEENLHALIDQVLKAYGGEGRLRGLKVFSLRWRESSEADSDTQGTETRLFVQLPGRARIEMEIPGPHGRTKHVVVLRGDQTWVKYGDYATGGVTEPGGRTGSVVDQYFPPSTVLKVKDPAFRAAWLGKASVEVARKDGKAFALEGAAVATKVRLFFDQETGLLLKSERELRAGGEIRKIELLYQDYRAVDGIPMAQKRVCKMDGKVVSRTEVLNFKLADKFDDKLFEKP
jgi:hypothetical protein